MGDNTDLTPAELERIAQLRAERIAEDIDMMQHPDRWPAEVLHLKTQPWVRPPSFGYKRAGSLIVFIKDAGKHEVFETIEELAARWSVD